MCTLGPLTKEKLTTKPIEGFRAWKIINSSNKLEGLFPLNQNNSIKFDLGNKKAKAIYNSKDFLNQIDGYYSYNYYSYNYNNYYNYYVIGKILHSGKIAHHKQGYRSTKAKPILLVNLDISGHLDFEAFKKHFNITVDKIAKMYQCKTMFWEEFTSLK